MPHGYTNNTTRFGSTVIKSYQGPDASARCGRERAVLSALAGRLPVPPVLASSGTSLRLGYMPGVHGQEMVERGFAAQVLAACGRMLRRIHAITPAEASVEAEHDGSAVLVHGDFGPNNVLVDTAGLMVVAVVDWEWAHAGDAVEDLAWCEWIIRMHHPRHVGALSSLFDAYGRRYSWRVRQQAMDGQCRALLALCERWQPGGDAVRQWQRRVEITESWTE